MFVVGKNLLAQFVNELIKAQINFGLYFIVEKLFAEYGQGVMGAVVVQIQRKQDAPEEHQKTLTQFSFIEKFRLHLLHH